MLNIRCLKDLRIWLSQWVSPASHLTLPKTHVRDSLVLQSTLAWDDGDTSKLWYGIRSSSLRSAVADGPSFFPFICFSSKQFRAEWLRWRRSKLWRWWPWPLLDPIKVSRKPVPEYYRHWNNTGPSSHQLYSRHHRLKRRFDHIS
jgi:hypothetical protein